MLMRVYEEEFAEYNLLCSQILITRSSLNNRTSYNNLRDSVGTLLDLGVIPIFNENDVVSTSEIGDVFGDNDRMSAYCASKMDAELLILLTDIDGVYTGNPKKDKDAVMEYVIMRYPNIDTDSIDNDTLKQFYMKCLEN